MVITRERSGNALRGSKTPGGNRGPETTVKLAISLVVVLKTSTPDQRVSSNDLDVPGGNTTGNNGSIRGVGLINAVVLGGGVLRVGSVVRATLQSGSRGENRNISPGGRVPVRVVVTLLIALISALVTVVLTGVGGSVSDTLVSNEETTVAKTSLAIQVVGGGLMNSVVELVGSCLPLLWLWGLAILETVLDPGAAHVLHDDLALNVGVVRTAAVLGGVLDLKERSLVVGHLRTPSITSVGVVLGVEQTVLVVVITTVATETHVRDAGSSFNKKKKGPPAHLPNPHTLLNTERCLQCCAQKICGREALIKKQKKRIRTPLHFQLGVAAQIPQHSDEHTGCCFHEGCGGTNPPKRWPKWPRAPEEQCAFLQGKINRHRYSVS
jgi:hypothetical protein